MTQDQLALAKDKDLPASLVAMRRAAKMARELAVQTNTAIIIMQNSQMVRVTAEMLRKELK